VAQPAAYLEDLMLVDRCLDGEQAAARELFRRQRGRVQATLYRILGSNRDMDDLLQESFIQIFRSLDSFRGEARLSTWIDRIAVRVAYRYLSNKKRSLLTVEMVDEPDGPRSQPDRRALAREGVRRLYAALAEQPAGGRIAFALHEIEGRSVAEVAAITGASFTATKLRIWRTRRALMKQAAQDPILAEFLRDDAVEELS
jgi:RNA polymerase sigma-70 factor (ECF subfamily)